MPRVIIVALFAAMAGWELGHNAGLIEGMKMGVEIDAMERIINDVHQIHP